MSVNFTKHSTPPWFHSWFGEHYSFRKRPVANDANAVCKRCGEIVWATIKHARNVHGDDLPDIGPTPSHIARGWLSDEQGRLVRRSDALV